MARLIDRLQGHRAIVDTLLDAVDERRLASTLLFAGPSGVGKKLAALVLAQSLICERGVRGACGECGSCIRIEKGQSESLLKLEPEGAQIKIEQARDVLQFIALRTLGRARVILIDQAHLLGAQAANALLKSLEEPPAGTYFILITHMAASVLPTIRSRSQLIRFRPLEVGELKTLLGNDADEWVLQSAQGSIEVARRLLEDREDFVNLEQATEAYLNASLEGFPSQEISSLRELLKERSSHAFVASLLQSACRDALRLQAGLPLSRTRFQEAIQALAGRPPEYVHRLATKTIEFEYDLGRNVDRALILENLALDLGQRK